MVRTVQVALAMWALAACAAGGRDRPLPRTELRPPPPPKVSTPADVAELVAQLSADDLRRLLEFAASAELERDPPITADGEYEPSPGWEPPPWDIEYGNEIDTAPPDPPSAASDELYLNENSPPNYWGAADEPEGAYTHSVGAVSAAEAGAGAGALPLMAHHNSKLHAGSSYSVPHYTVTGGSGGGGVYGAAGAGAGAGGVSVSVFRSRGAAYTLHPDGSLSPEGPPRTRPHKYGQH